MCSHMNIEIGLPTKRCITLATLKRFMYAPISYRKKMKENRIEKNCIKNSGQILSLYNKFYLFFYHIKKNINNKRI